CIRDFYGSGLDSW
nr:immunoglobulin heavy chain junction region [Macaca mulatta]MOX39644.1 immunoglobulin heavy chain junction region [Macaca mulatta]MOX39714.1 immunoglobulin heavy chain junction region [Macaca mulatta]MOX40126.1 immunoglobulin heavy chain junction region [Macaca mulatta]MOX41206.1 immunoglobulin heavy chain junction region [Macaca mulatta]